MQAFVRVTGVVAPLDRSNVDTDAIIPKQFLKSIERTGFGVNLFDEWRYVTDSGGARVENPAFVLNQEPYRQARILVSRANFGCGSSREHAPWALLDFGFRVVIAPSFADIFYNNCLKNGLLPVVLPEAAVDDLFAQCGAHRGFQVAVDLEAQTVTPEGGAAIAFSIDAFRKRSLLLGLDEIGQTLERASVIRAYEARRKADAPWLFIDL